MNTEIMVARQAYRRYVCQNAIARYPRIELFREMKKTQLRYRGVPYTRTSSPVAQTCSHQGKYRGRKWSAPPLDEAFVVASTAPLKYRGVEYFGAVRPYALSGLLDSPWIDMAPADDLWLLLSTSG